MSAMKEMMRDDEISPDRDEKAAGVHVEDARAMKEANNAARSKVVYNVSVTLLPRIGPP